MISTIDVIDIVVDFLNHFPEMLMMSKLPFTFDMYCINFVRLDGMFPSGAVGKFSITFPGTGCPVPDFGNS